MKVTVSILLVLVICLGVFTLGLNKDKNRSELELVNLQNDNQTLLLDKSNLSQENSLLRQQLNNQLQKHEQLVLESYALNSSLKKSITENKELYDELQLKNSDIAELRAITENLTIEKSELINYYLLEISSLNSQINVLKTQIANLEIPVEITYREFSSLNEFTTWFRNHLEYDYTKYTYLNYLLISALKEGYLVSQCWFNSKWGVLAHIGYDYYWLNPVQDRFSVPIWVEPAIIFD